MATQKKVTVVEELTDKVAKAKAIILADYTGIKHKQLEELRKKLKAAKGEFTVIKNTLLKRALDANKKTLPESDLRDSSAALFSYEDEVAPLKEMVAFFKSVNLGKLKAGLIGNDAMSAGDIEKVSKLPSKKELHGKLVGQLQAPIYGLHNALSWNLRKLVWTLNAVKATKS